MPDDPITSPLTTNCGVNSDAAGISINGDVVGRDKITQNTWIRQFVLTPWVWLVSAVVIAIGLIAISIIFNITTLRALMPTPTPLPTPLAFPAASNNETLIIIADFYDRGTDLFADVNLAQRIEDSIKEKLPKSVKPRVEPLHQSVKDSTEARLILTSYGATLLIWGWYDRFGATPKIETNAKRGGLPNPEQPGMPLSASKDMETFFTRDIPAQSAYLAFVSLGQMQSYTDRNIALALFTQAIDSAVQGSNVEEITPWQAFMWRGNAYGQSGESGLAIADHTEAVKLHPSLETYLSRGMAYHDQGEFDAAIADYTQAIARDTTYEPTYLKRGAAYKYQNKLDEAISDYTQAITLKPQYKEAYLNRGIVYGLQRKFETAIADFMQAIAIDSHYKEAYFNRGMIYELQGEIDVAIADYTLAIAIDPTYADAYYKRGSAYKSNGKEDQARGDFEKFLSLSPDGYWRRQAQDQLRNIPSPILPQMPSIDSMLFAADNLNRPPSKANF